MRSSNRETASRPSYKEILKSSPMTLPVIGVTLLLCVFDNKGSNTITLRLMHYIHQGCIGYVH